MLDFWKKVCAELDYRFFTGVPDKSLKDIFNSLNPDLLHFVPTVNDSIAVGLAAGVSLRGYKSVVLCNDYTLINTSAQIDNFLVRNNIPVLFITNSDKNIGLRAFDLSKGYGVLDQANDFMVTEKLPTLIKI